MSSNKSYGITEFLKFATPMLWTGSCAVKLLTVLMMVSLLLSRAMQVVHPLLLKQVVINITCDDATTELEDGCPDAQETYMIIVIYGCIKFTADLLNYIREVPFSYMSANAEKKIAAMVYSHI